MRHQLSGPLDYEGETNMLFHNNCDGHLRMLRRSRASAPMWTHHGRDGGDFDNDGWDDIYVANDRTENFLFHNKHDERLKRSAAIQARRLGRTANQLLRWGRVCGS